MRNLITYSAKLLIASLAVGGLLYFSNITAISEALKGANFKYVAAGTLLFLAGQFLSSQRWRGILRSRSLNVAAVTAFRLNLIGTFAGNFLPGQGSGDLVKIAFLFERFPQSKQFLLVSVVYDRLLGLLAILSLSGVMSVLLFLRNGSWSAFHYVGWAALLVSLLFLLMTQLHRVQRLYRFLGGKLSSQVSDFSESLFNLFSNIPLLYKSFALSIIFQLSWALSLWLMLLAVEPNAAVLPVLIAAPISVLIAAIPVTVGGLGLREGAFSLMMQQFGTAADNATTAALLSLLPILVASIIGGGLLLWKRLSRNSTKSTGQIL